VISCFLGLGAAIRGLGAAIRRLLTRTFE